LKKPFSFFAKKTEGVEREVKSERRLREKRGKVLRDLGIVGG